MKAFLLFPFMLLQGFMATGQNPYNVPIADTGDKNYNPCNVPINADKILHNTNLDFFLKKLRSDTFNTSYEKQKIPAYIQKKLYCLTGKLANPDEAWQETDLVIEELPWRKLEFFSVNRQQDLFVVVYKHGGIGVSTIIMLIKLTEQGIIIDSQKNVEDIWIGQTFFEGKTITDLLNFINQNRYKHFGLNTNWIYY